MDGGAVTTQPTTTDDAAAPPTPTRRRPRDRKAQIVKVAARAFSERGYHSVGVDEIAAEVGISGPALYRHFPNKYALFVAAADESVLALIRATESSGRPLNPREQLEARISELISITIENRRFGGIYRWEGRYLEDADRERIGAHFAELNRRLIEPLRQLRPDLVDEDLSMLAAATLSVIASITVHRIALPAGRIEALTTTLVQTVVTIDLPAPPAEPRAQQTERSGLTMNSKREILISAALDIFHDRGYHDSNIEDIGAAAGINASSVYRYFASKAELLAAVYYRANDRLAMATSDALGASTTPHEALDKLVERYVSLSFATPKQLAVYFAEFGNLPATERSVLRTLQRQHIEEWVHLLTTVYPATPAVDARFRVHAALGMVLDVGRLIRFDRSAQSHDRVCALMRNVLFEGHESS
jgi:AcrR family transcriptional regulator